MLIIIIGLAITSAVLELMIAAQLPFLRQWSHKSKLFNLINSMFLSYLVGLAFGAQGMVVMTAGILSTFLTIPGYALLHWNYDTEKAKSVGGNRYDNAKTNFKKVSSKKRK